LPYIETELLLLLSDFFSLLELKHLSVLSV